ncbi:MAG: hypothetical protein JWL98_1560, partial [Xanthomonadaceae bacterium]|nr:hypothetical protein [Xanthomonadaceae bacterium]
VDFRGHDARGWHLSTQDTASRSAMPLWSTYATTVAFVALLLLAYLLFHPALSGPFVFDDFPNLANLTQLGGEATRASLGQYLAAFTGNPGRPLAALSFLIEDSAWPTVPGPYKRDNLLFHLLAGVLVFALSRRMARALPKTAPWSDAIALATMAIWLLHPMQLSATMLVVQRMNILCSIAVLAGLAGYARVIGGVRDPGVGRVVAAGVVLSVSALVAFLCKENGVLVFAYAAVLNATLLRGDIERFAPANRRLLIAGCALPIVALAGAALIGHRQISSGYLFRPFTLGERLLTEARIMFDYLGSILTPRIGGAGVFHDDYAVSHDLFSPPGTALALLAIGALLIAAWRLRTRAPLFSLAVFWFFAGHLIESTVWPLELYFEHRNYLPMVGPLYALAATVATAAPRYRRGAWLLLCAWIAIAAGLTALNARTWGDRGALARVWLQENPRSVRAVQMLTSYQYDTGDAAGARRTLMDGLARMPEAGELAMQVALLDCYTRGLPASQWSGLLSLASHVRRSHIVPDMASKFGNEARGNRCHGTLPDGGFLQLTQALIRNPAFAGDGGTLAYLYVEMSKQAVAEHDLGRAMASLDAAYSYGHNPLVARNQAIYLLTAGLPDDAMEYLRKSENSEQPWFKRQLLDMPTLNQRLWFSARKMRHDMAH